MAIEIVGFPIKNGGSFHSYVNVHVPEGKSVLRYHFFSDPFFLSLHLTSSGATPKFLKQGHPLPNLAKLVRLVPSPRLLGHTTEDH